MTPGEAAAFYEEDEDPAEIFAWFDAGAEGRSGVTVAGCAPDLPARAAAP